MPAAELRAMRKEFESVISEAKLMAFIQVVRRQGEANIGDVAELAKEVGIDPGKLTVGQVFFDGTPSSGKEWAKSQRALGPAGSSGINTRTAKGRKEFDAKILKILRQQDGWTAARAIRGITGGSPHQVRVSLNRLCESGDVEFMGQARATRYLARKVK